MRLFPLVAALGLGLAAPIVAQTPPPSSKGSDPSKPTAPQAPKEIAGETLEQWAKKLKGSDASARDAALKVVPLFGDAARKYVKDMIPLINDSDNTVKVTAMMTLTLLPIEEPKEKAEIIRRLRSHIEFTGGIMRLHACVCVAQYGLEAGNCVGPLTYALKDMSSYEIRKAAAQALGRVGAPDDLNGPNLQALSALINQMTDPSLAVRVEVVQALIMLGAPADPDIRDQEKRMLLSRMEKETDKVLPIWLRVCLMRLDSSLVTELNIGYISKLLKDPKLRMAAAEAIGFMGKAAKSRVFELMEGLKSDKPEDVPFLVMCMWALSCMGTEAKAAAPELEKYTKHKDEFIKLNAQQAYDLVTGKKKP